MRIAFIGATGMLGQPVASEFIRAGFSVRLITRNVAQTKAMFPQADVVPGDMRNAETLVVALQGVDVVYLNLSVKQDESAFDFHTESGGIVNLIQATRQTGVQRIVYLSSIIMRYQGTNDFRWWVFDIKHKAVQSIKESGISYSIFYPSCFMESLNGTQRIGRFVLLVGRSDVKPWYIAAHDYAQQVVRALQIVQSGQNQEYVVQGPEPITQHEAAERFVAAYPHKKLHVVTAPASLMKLGRAFTAQANYGWHITEALNKYSETFEAENTWSDLGKPQTTIEQFAKF